MRYDTFQAAARFSRRVCCAFSIRKRATMNPTYFDFIGRDPHICGGEAVVRGTRIPVRTILASLAEGAWIDEILADFPTLNEAQVRAVVSFAAASASSRSQKSSGHG